MSRWFILAIASLLPLPVLAAEPILKDAERKPDVIYCRKDGVCLTMDVFMPTGKKNGLGVIAVVSGGWRSDHNEIERFAPLLGAELVKRGYTVFAVVHGSQPKYNILEAIADIRKAVRYIRHNASHYGIDPDRLGITGASAGCHLSLMIGLTGEDGNPKAKDPVDRQSSRVAAIAGFFPPTDFFNYGQEGRSAEPLTRTGPFSPAFDFRERDPKTNNWKPVSEERRREILRDISPVYHVSASAPPTLLIHGDMDALVPLQQSKLLIDKLKEHNVPCELAVVKDGGHGWKEIQRDCVRIADWFDQYLIKK